MVERTDTENGWSRFDYSATRQVSILTGKACAQLCTKHDQRHTSRTAHRLDVVGVWRQHPTFRKSNKLAVEQGREILISRLTCLLPKKDSLSKNRSMIVRSPRKRARLSGKTIRRIATLAWGMAVGMCAWAMISQTAKVVSNETKAPPTSYLRDNDYGVLSPGNEVQRRPPWLGGRMQVLSRLENSFVIPKPQDQPESGKVPGVPDWARQGAIQHVQMTEDGQYIDPQCRGFDYTIMRPTHGCQVNQHTYLVYCNFENLRVDNRKITMDRGGERLDQVMGRPEDPEFPTYEKGAFTTLTKPVFDVPNEYRTDLHYLENVLNNLQYPTKKRKEVESSCVETWDGTTLVITRYEYVNLYHTLTDWWNAYSVLPLDDNNRPLRVLFLDGHAQGNLDDTWKQVFGPYTYVQHLPPGGLCLEQAIFVPPGYLSLLFPDPPKPRYQCPLRRIARDFAEHFLDSYGLLNVKPIKGKVVIIDRQPYVSHPRSNPSLFVRVLSNLGELRTMLSNTDAVTSVEIVRFETMSMKEQLRTIREANILIGNHGAGLSHLMFMDLSAHVIEFNADAAVFFDYLSQWRGVMYSQVAIDSEERLDHSELLEAYALVMKVLKSP